MGKTVTIPTHPFDHHYCVNDHEYLNLKFVEDGNLEASGDITAFKPHLDSHAFRAGDSKSYEALSVGAEVEWRYLEGGAVINKGTFAIKHNDQTCED